MKREERVYGTGSPKLGTSAASAVLKKHEKMLRKKECQAEVQRKEWKFSAPWGTGNDQDPPAPEAILKGPSRMSRAGLSFGRWRKMPVRPD